jgi:hypothetical protein
MVLIDEFPYRYADAVLKHAVEFNEAYNEIISILENIEIPLLNPTGDPKKGGVKRRERKGTKSDPRKRYLFFPVDQKTLNLNLDRDFKENSWELHPLVVNAGSPQGPETGLKADYKKGKLQVEVQFGNMARWYTDVFKFQLSYSLGKIDVAVLVVPKQRFANLIDENVAQFERVVRELPWAKMSLTLPILVIGIEPENYESIEECYNQAARHWQEEKRSRGEDIIIIPFSKLLEEDQSNEESL